MKKSFIIIVLLLLIFSCQKSEETNISKIIIYSVNFNIDTAVEVECNDFESTFSKKIKMDSIKDKSTLNKFEALLKNTKKSDENTSLNVRKKIVVFYKNNSVDTLCIDRFNIMINNQLIDKDSNFLDYIIDL